MSQSTRFEVVVNDETVEVGRGQTIAQLLDQIDIHHRAIAVELNFEIQPRDQFATTALQPGDRLEIVTLVGGG